MTGIDFDASKWYVEEFKVIEPPEPKIKSLLNERTEIKSKQAEKYAKQLNPDLFKKRKKYNMTVSLFCMAMLLYLVCVQYAYYIVEPVLFAFCLFFSVKHRRYYKKCKNLKKLIRSLKTAQKAEYYIKSIKSARFTDMPFGNLPFRYDSMAIYGNNNEIFSKENICFLYIKGYTIVFGTTRKDLISLDIPLDDREQIWVINFFEENPDIIIGKENFDKFNEIKIK